MSLYELRPLKQLHEISKVYPDAWKWVEKFFKAKGNELPAWPKHVFLPMAGWREIVCDGSGEEVLDLRLGCDIYRLSAIGTWRYTQGVYRFDSDFYAEISETDLNGNIPVDVLFRLPEWCIYVETPGRDLLGRALHGFYAHLENDEITQCWQFWFFLDAEGFLFPFVIDVGPWTVIEGIDRALAEANRVWDLGGNPKLMFSDTERHSFANIVKPLLSMVLYLCSEEPEIEGPLPGRPSQPKPKKTRKGMRLFAPNRPTIWKIGSTTGQLLRTARTGTSERSEGKSPRAHVRRAHWHGYWVGPKEKQEFQYRWLPPIFVSGEADQDPAKKAA
ncbi:MAG: AcrVA2 family anti-CRISPR protein [Geobacteraceae bacterium]